MTKRNWIVLIIIIAGLGAWYYFTTAFNVLELKEESPLALRVGEEQIEIREIKDDLAKMDEKKLAEFKRQVEQASEEKIVMTEAMPAGPKLIAQGNFKTRAHDVAGRALLIADGEQKTLRFEDFETINGPNLHIYLASELGVADAIDLGPIRATKGDVNYPLAADLDLTRYNKVLVWCVPFRVLFSYAELQ
ncbi:MAG: hypothetical protein A2788_01305 [Candidatus Abawacabacteria bacterium RIFCSPHIGHO2_01_FULL_46_8]|uniref:DM13 domain-containing protein n=1 Tax=Candidatus Abawacabacteria bacterium RIFCSPHIGHO2_01_FULL_46_8 TaxID=1817815 RepID=A0A1F4XJN4_9BACT|nr:MAG: hypothetical protein A2788_01305 [Candidatus Abawacabacteria bacterium RIFCSPHIGHO2_01_FULL_46_8]